MLTFHVRLSAEGGHTEDFGEIYLETEHGYFPGLGWTDLVWNVVSLWMGNTLQMLDPKDDEPVVTFNFMDGPFVFTLERTEQVGLIMRFLRRPDEPEESEELPSLHTSFAEYGEAFVSLAEQIINDPAFGWLGSEKGRSRFQKFAAELRAKWPS